MLHYRGKGIFVNMTKLKIFAEVIRSPSSVIKSSSTSLLQDMWAQDTLSTSPLHVSCLFYTNHSNRSENDISCGNDLHFTDIEHLFIYLFVCISSLEKCLLGFLPILKSDCVCVCIFVISCMIALMFWILTHQIYDLQIFFSHVTFYFVDGLLCRSFLV